MHVRVLQVSTLFSVLLATCTLSAGPLTSGEETALLDGHNQIRADVANGQVAGQPSATNMTELVWDADLAAVASAWANNCTFAHNAKRSAEYQAQSGNNDYVGENIYAQSNDSGVSDAALNAWFGEHTAYTYEAFTGGGTGHYTQLIWANTLRVGCAQATCPNMFFAPNAQLLVCDYAPGGNFIGQYPYESGTPASNCPPERPFAQNGLCVATADTDNDGLPDNTGNCPNDANAGQEDFDLEVAGDVCAPEDDNDGLPDVTEDSNEKGIVDSGETDPLDRDRPAGLRQQPRRTDRWLRSQRQPHGSEPAQDTGPR